MTIGKRPFDCQLCWFFDRLKTEYRKGSRYTQHVRLFTHIRPPYRTDATASAQHPFLSVLRDNSRLAYDHGVEVEIKQAGLIGYLPDGGTGEVGIRAVNASVDYGAVRRQLEHCIHNHEQCKPSKDSTSALPYIVLIDCDHGEVVKRTLADGYMTLSYVWGQQQLCTQDIIARSSLLDEAPLTIRDAMQVVRNLGQKYLWVDRYCIDQDDDVEKERMIRLMDLIYENSLATIVALHGENDRSGLPGVSATPRKAQLSFKTKDGRLISSCPPISTMISTSKWNTRGWTYQEARLSRSCLFFSAHQVYCVCRQSTWSEAVPFDPSLNSLTYLLNSSQLDGPLFEVDFWDGGGFSTDRSQYTRRMLTFEHDALAAFRGILRRSSFITYWGVPVVLQGSGVDVDTGFALGQLWTTRTGWSKGSHLQPTITETSTRRAGLPTWSWTCLTAEIYQQAYSRESLYGQYFHGTPVVFPQNESQIRFWLLSGDDRTPLQAIISTDDSVTLYEHNRQLLVEGNLVRLRYATRGITHKWYQMFKSWRYLLPDVCCDQHDWPGQPILADLGGERYEDVLVLIQWHDHQKSSMKRFVLMVLNWIDDNHAERIGLLTEYIEEFPAAWIDQLPRYRRQFILQ